jgi:hypothetical protein
MHLKSFGGDHMADNKSAPKRTCREFMDGELFSEHDGENPVPELLV